MTGAERRPQALSCEQKSDWRRHTSGTMLTRQSLETMASVALVLALVPLQKFLKDFNRFSSGSALFKVKMALPSQR